mmetsp:Transcript_19896/g.64745  ORF Transcript_19896/g.64745 Transcript_19896/m.64745 type:complete len:627 (-) Transcript_19896:87-1967(-)|eukprot:CAMPEP_0170148552 /NCGR_PEP_ID=MMETSP0033_2-20121228/39437_1 /TAXON_ID=195969 /ORGANISM="Dolichomastix tenuilepis, Strain CCMP3274" /LENGTH=626 /DNA_ID=CAMNT_0010385447 /DNA_START=70 /DNA_END=1950 /DNA_ORIENTATION=+
MIRATTTTPGKYRVVFFPTGVRGAERARIVGQPDALGGWDPRRSVRAGDVVEFPQGAELEYKYVVEDENGGDLLRWEELEGNRTLQLPLGSAYAFDLVVTDQVEGWTLHDALEGEERAERGIEPSVPAPTILEELIEPIPVQNHAPPAPASDSIYPEWYKDAVVYQVQTLGFCGAEGLPNDGESPPEPRLRRFLEEGWLDHIASLGATVLYLGPLFESCELGHGYDTADYFRVDRRLGDEALLREVIKAAHQAGLRVILDGVFNHTGSRHFAAVDVMENGRASKYWDWFHCRLDGHEGGVIFEGWEGHNGLIRFNHQNRAVRDHIFDVARYWLAGGEEGIDGWRLDVAHEVDPHFWAEFSGVCREARADSLLLGELMHGDYTHFVKPGFLHSGTNYQLHKAMWSCLNDSNYHELAHALERDRNVYGSLLLLNFLSCHDTPRLASRLNDAERHSPLAVAQLMLGAGVPCLYYGEEFGLEGAPGGPEGDRAMRQTVNLHEQLQNPRARELFDHTKKLIELRKAHPSLRDGRVRADVLNCTNTLISFSRTNDGETTVFVLNCSGDSQEVRAMVHGVAENAVFEEILDDGRKHERTSVEGGAISVSCPPFTARALVHPPPPEAKWTMTSF